MRKEYSRTRSIALLTGGILAASSLLQSAPAQASKSKTYKTGAIVLGAAAAYLLIKHKPLPAAVAGAGAYYAYKKGQKAQQNERYGYNPNDRYSQYPDNSYPNNSYPDTSYPNNNYPDGNYSNGGYDNGGYNNGSYDNGSYANGGYSNSGYPDDQYSRYPNNTGYSSGSGANCDHSQNNSGYGQNNSGTGSYGTDNSNQYPNYGYRALAHSHHRSR